MDDQVKILEENRNGILFIELAGLLHDLGKLSKKFIDYRQGWQEDPDGWYGKKDPHEHGFLDVHETWPLIGLVPNIFTKPISEFSTNDLGEKDFSIKKAVQDHHKKNDETGDITKMLQAADATDAAHDRNNPLFSAEQIDKIYRSNVYGFEQGRELNPSDLEEAREKLYIALDKSLPAYLSKFDPPARESVFDHIESAFSRGLADTTRPQNDTTLWEHAYAVASILKILTVHNLFHPETKVLTFGDVRFGILGLGWDGLGFISYGQKIGDIVGRKQVIDSIREACRDIIELQYPLGNRIYEDDNGIYFIVPANFGLEEYPTLRNLVLSEIHKAVASLSGGELQAKVVDIPETVTLTSIVDAIQQMQSKSIFRFVSGSDGFTAGHATVNTFAGGNTVCPVCRLRPVHKKEADSKICEICSKRRRNAAQLQRQTDNGQTVFIDEIASATKGAALIVARFDLRDWLDGTMVRSLFVTEQQGIQREIGSLGTILAFGENENKALQDNFDGKKYNYQQIKEDIDSFFKTDPVSLKRAQHAAFLYAYGRPEISDPSKVKLDNIRLNWEKVKESAMPELKDKSKEEIFLYNMLLAKSPTPSTILDVWSTTEQFFREAIRTILSNDKLFTETHRLRVTVKGDLPAIDHGGTLEAEIQQHGHGRKNIELVWCKPDSCFEIIGEKFDAETKKNYRNAIIRITDKEYSAPSKTFTVAACAPGTPILPYRVITQTPSLFMAIVPADKALAVTKAISTKYTEWFGKVQGRLPFSIGNIFFRKKMPMFVVLDAAKKMVRNFERLAEPDQKRDFRVEAKQEKAGETIFRLTTSFSDDSDAHAREVRWGLPVALGNGESDYHHPYFTVKEGDKELPARPSYFPTVAGDVVHFTDFEPGDILRLYPNYFDFEFLDSNSRRHDIAIDKNRRRLSVTANFRSRPLLLEELPQKLGFLWEQFTGPGPFGSMTDTKLNSIRALWLEKFREWDVNLDQPKEEGFTHWKELVTATIKQEFKDLADEQNQLLLEMICNGLFFDMLELYYSILKEKIQSK